MRLRQGERMTLHKLTGAGNCFLLIDLLQTRSHKRGKNRFVPKGKRRQLAKKLCDLHTGIGADGLLFLESSKIADLKWDFYNADGSNAEMCGNAARCVGAYLLQQYERVLCTTISTRSGVIEVEPLAKKGAFRVTMPTIREIELGREFDFVDSGVPHAVVCIKFRSLFENVKDLEKIVDKIRSLRRFKKRGVNVTFYLAPQGRQKKRSTSRNINSLTFERGVGGFTQACGTGAVAAATSFAAHSALTRGRVNVRVPGGQLVVELGQTRPILSGPASYIAEIHVNI